MTSAVPVFPRVSTAIALGVFNPTRPVDTERLAWQSRDLYDTDVRTLERRVGRPALECCVRNIWPRRIDYGPHLHRLRGCVYCCALFYSERA